MAKYDLTIREEELKNLVRDDWFGKYDGNKIIGNIDLSVCMPTVPNQLEIFDLDFFLWAEAKKGNKEDIDDSLVQLMITIMKAHTYNDYLPPLYLGAFDAEKIAFVPYNDKLQRQVIFDQVLENKIDWTRITPSDHTTEEFQLVKKKAKDVLLGKILFNFVSEEKDLRQFIKSNFIAAKTSTNKINITLNRMTSIFNRWLDVVKPTIKVSWTKWAEIGILPADFFLADAISKNNQSLGESLQVLLRSNAYQVKLQTLFGEALRTVEFTDHQKAHKTFWNKYNRPPRRRERLQMQERRDLLVEPDRRERKGAYFTPSRWVDLSREYLTDVLGTNWQEEYYVWDCCAGTGNLLYGLTEKERIFASTLDEADVTYLKTQENLLPAHVFQFDFLNDDLQGDKVPEDLKRILQDPDERKKLVIYINPPYAEAGDARQSAGTGKNKAKVSIETKMYVQYKELVGKAVQELFAQFFIRIYKEIPSCRLAEFSKLKILQAPNFVDFRAAFRAKLESLFIVPADTFDNVKGQFPIGFFIWNTDKKETFESIYGDVYNAHGEFQGNKNIFALSRNQKTLTDWVVKTRDKGGNIYVGYICNRSNDFQSQTSNFIANTKEQFSTPRGSIITEQNLLECSIFYAVRHVIPATWLNDRDQFLYPRKAWKKDKEFQYDCLAYTLFNTNIQSQFGSNHWIPFTEQDLQAPDKFQSHFMADFIAGKLKPQTADTLFGAEESLIPTEPIQFSPEAQAVMDAGRELWYYYMHHKDKELYGAQSINVNASYYDIRRYFQGVDDKGRMNSDSKDETYMRLWGKIKEAQKVLAKKIEPKVYLYGFLLDETTLPEDEPEAVETPKQLPAKTTTKVQSKKKKPNQTIVNHYHINAQNISLQTEGTINIGEINDK